MQLVCSGFCVWICRIKAICIIIMAVLKMDIDKFIISHPEVSLTNLSIIYTALIFHKPMLYSCNAICYLMTEQWIIVAIDWYARVSCPYNIVKHITISTYHCEAYYNINISLWSILQYQHIIFRDEWINRLRNIAYFS